MSGVFADSVLAKVVQQDNAKVLMHLFSEEEAKKTIQESLLNLRDTAALRIEQYIKCCLTKETSMRYGKKRPYIFTAVKNFGEIKE